jgi:hypothetical protein
VAKKLSVERYSYRVYGEALSQELKLEEFEYDNKKLVAWLRDRSIKLLCENEFAAVIQYGVVFKQPVQFAMGGAAVPVRGIELHLECRRYWVAQTIRDDVTHGLYDHLKDAVIIPDKEYWSMEFDVRNWRVIILEGEPEPSEPEPGTIQLGMVLFNPIFGSEHGPTPLLDDLIHKEFTQSHPSL